MKVNEDYAVKTLQSSETRDAIEIEDYVRLKIEMNLI
jgi:hypothetical protein